MLSEFTKYQSLGNDFVIFDWYKKPDMFVQKVIHEDSWKDFVIKTCDRNYGIGADGIIILRRDQEEMMHDIIIYNADGSFGQTCLNGLRSAAHYLYTNHKIPSLFSIKMGARKISCQINLSENNSGAIDNIVMVVGKVVCGEQKTVTIGNKKLSGHTADVGNPHWVFFEQTTPLWLKEHGPSLESHHLFPHKTNVEFVWRTDTSPTSYQVLIYERGCGMTKACSSGVSAILGLLFKKSVIKKEQQITFHMPGGPLIGWVDAQEDIILKGQAVRVFSGKL